MLDLFILSLTRNFVWDHLRDTWAFIDRMLYSCVRLLFNAIFGIANFDLLDLFIDFQERIYVILGIFMLFKVTISLISYLVNPDKISDKQQGASQLVIRIITVLVLLISLPTFFSLLTEAQNRLLPVIPRIIIGETTTLDGNEVNSIAEDMALTMLKGFVHVQDINQCGEDEIVDFDSFNDHINDTCMLDGKKVYKYDYLFIVPTIWGIIVISVLMIMAVTVGMRAFKMIILKVVAPIPIISYIDPKSSKDGAFSSWIKLLFTTWIDIFIILGVLYFVVYLLDRVLSFEFLKEFSVNSAIGGGINWYFVYSTLCFSLILFAFQAPKFIKEALGIKSSGSIIKMLSLGLSTAGMVGSAFSTTSAANEYDRRNGRDPNYLRNIGSGILSGLVGGVKASNAIFSSSDPRLTTGLDALNQHSAQAYDRALNNSTLFGRAGNFFTTLFTGQSSYDRLNHNLENYKRSYDATSAFLSGSKSKALDADANGKKGITVDIGEHKGLNYKVLKENISGAQSGDASSIEYLMNKGFVKKAMVEEKYYDTEKVYLGKEWVWNDDGSDQIEVEKYETKQVEKTRMVEKDVADWQAAYSLLSEVEDKQVNEHMRRIANNTYIYVDRDQNGDIILDENGNAIEHETAGGSAYDGTNYDKYERAVDANKGITYEEEDEDGNTVVRNATFDTDDCNTGFLSSVKKVAGKTTDKIREIERSDEYKAASKNKK